MRVDNDSNLDEVTGLSAFDDLDPISAVSELAPLPEAPVWTGGTSDSGVPPATTAQPSSVPPPVSSTRPYTSAPPPPSSTSPVSHRSFPAPAAESLATKHFDLDGPDEPGDADVTMQLDASELMSAGMLPGGPFATVLPGAAEHEGIDDDERAAGPDDTEVVDLPPTAAANLEMDWDDEELETRLRDEPFTMDESYGAAAASASLVPGGNPSPFPVAPATSFPPPPAWGAGAQQAGAVTAERAADRGQRATVEMEAPREGFLSTRGGMLAAVVALGLVAVWAASAMLSPSEATITLATTPSDAEVSLDGERLVEQTSPYVLTVKADEPHQLVVSKDGYESYTMALEVQGGDNKALPQIELRPIIKDTGFTIDSAPAGLQVLIDGKPTGQVTPARVLEVAGGAHKVSLAVPAGYESFEIRVFVQDNQVIELPKAELIRSQGVAARRQAPAAPAEAVSSAPPVERSGRTSRTASSSRVASSRPRSSAPTASRFGGGAAPARKASVATNGASDGSGTLRLNSRPWSQISIDGRPVGNTPQLNLSVPAGSHTIKFSNPQMGLAKTVKVKVRKGQTVTQVVNLID